MMPLADCAQDTTALVRPCLAKLTVLRYGGLRLYRVALPFFLGLILGDCTMGTLWSLIGLLLGTPTYNFWGA